MLKRSAKIAVAVTLSVMFTVSLAQLTICLWQRLDFAHEVNEWLDQSGLGQYKSLFRNRGECGKSKCAHVALLLLRKTGWADDRRVAEANCRRMAIGKICVGSDGVFAKVGRLWVVVLIAYGGSSVHSRVYVCWVTWVEVGGGGECTMKRIHRIGQTGVPATHGMRYI